MNLPVETAQTFAGQVAIVSGAASGIGAATAALLGARGAAVVLADIDEEGVERRADALRECGVEAEGLTADVSRAAGCAATVECALGRFGRLDLLVNNAALGVFGATIETTTEKEWDRVVATNLKSVFLLSQAAVGALRAAGGGCIVNVSSVHALQTSRGVIAYAAAKGGVLSMTRALAIELAADRIRVVVILPGAVDTPMLAEQAEREAKSLEELGFSRDLRMIGRVGKPEEIAEVIAFAASPAASFITGSAITADGGLLAAF